ncbi:MAG: 2OG-Fe(II) oxygenase [Pseudomonadota bacterium]
MSARFWSRRVARYDWGAIGGALDADGWALLPSLLDGPQCAALAAGYQDPALFRSRVLMARHGYGRGQYQYYAYPLPDPVAALRQALYGPLARIANGWHAALRPSPRFPLFPARHAAFLARCHQAGQCRPTPLLLQYKSGDYNCLHQDIYGEQLFPLQVVVLLSRPGIDFEGGELVLTEQRPRRQSRVEVLPLRQGDAAVFPVAARPVAGAAGAYQVRMRHGVSRLRAGLRHNLGLIFHDAA